MEHPQKPSVSPNYERSSNFAQRVKDLRPNPKVIPQWIEKIDDFWYQRRASNGRHSFVLVIPELGEQRPAFDHERLARELSVRGVPTSAETLPFHSINFDSTLSNIQFHAEGKRWEFYKDGSLKELSGAVDGEHLHPASEGSNGYLQPLREERPSKPTDSKVLLTFVNQRTKPISILWIDWESKAHQYGNVQPGQSKCQSTFVEHVWRVTDAEDGYRIASFVALETDATALITEDIKCSDSPSNTADTATRLQNVQTHEEKFETFVRDFNIWIRDDGAEETRLSQTGIKTAPYDEIHIYNSPDSRYVVCWQYTLEQERMVSVVDIQPDDRIQPRLKQFQYLKPGDEVRRDRPRLFKIATKTEVNTNDSLFSDPYKITNIGWSLDGQEYRFLYNQRGHQILRIVGINQDGRARSIIEEKSDTFIDYSSKMFHYELKNRQEMIWMSERDGNNHLYLYDLPSGKLKSQLTSGIWNVRSVELVDEEQQIIWLKGVGAIEGQDPYYVHLMRVSLDGSDFKIVTSGDGTHEWTWTPSRKYLIDSWSRVDFMTQTSVVEIGSGKRFLIQGGGYPEWSKEAGWSVPERFAAPGRDGSTMIYGIIIRPSMLDTQRSYPVIEEIYAGPQGYSVPKSFRLLTAQHELAELGFVVVRIDGMGTNWRNKAFHNYCYKNLHDAGLPDRIAWMCAAAKSRPWMDLSRVGIYGGSAGGQNALSAMLWFGDFYKAAIADCGCHDNRLDKLWWNEQWMGWPVDASYEESSNVVHAKRLQGSLLLIVGGLDDNVDPASTMQVVHALNNAEKDYELLVFPRHGHGAGGSGDYAVRRQRDFFVRHLMQVTPPKRNFLKS